MQKNNGNKNNNLPLYRNYLTNKTIQKKEIEWWEKNASIVSKVWEMHEEISWSARKNYLEEAKNFFKSNKKKMTVLELGCGSGWVGQFLANSKLQIIGSDFSKSQIQLAKNRAKRKGLDKYCTYIVSHSLDLPKIIKSVDRILIHTFLHHLNGKEIEELLKNIKSKCKEGTKLWIYEPAFYEAVDTDYINKPKVTTLFILQIAGFIHEKLTKILFKFDLIDKKTYDDFQKLIEVARRKGWYLSPKEVPFNLERFTKQLKNEFKVSNHYWATIYMIGWFFNVNLIKNKSVRLLIHKLLIPLFSFVDDLTRKDINYLKNCFRAPNYAFHVWECVVNK